MQDQQLSHRIAVACGAVSAAAFIAWFVYGLVAIRFEGGTPVVAVVEVLGVLATVPLFALPAAAVVLALRSGWQRTAGLVLLAGAGLWSLRDLFVVGLVEPLRAGGVFLLMPVAVVAAVAAGVAAVVALHARGLGPLWGPDRVGGWRILAAIAVAVPAVWELAGVIAATQRGANLWFVFTALVGVVVAVVLAVGVLRIADGRVVALILATPGAFALTRVVGLGRQLVAVDQSGAEAMVSPPWPDAAVQLIVHAALSAAVVGCWAAYRPLRDAPLTAAPTDADSPSSRHGGPHTGGMR